MFGFSKMFGIGKKAVEEKRLKELDRLQRERQIITDHIAVIQQLQGPELEAFGHAECKKVQEPVCLAAALKLDKKDMVKERTYSEQRELDMAARRRREESERQARLASIERERHEAEGRQARIHEFARQSQLREEAELRYREEERMIRRSRSDDFIITPDQPQSTFGEVAGELATALAVAVIAKEVVEQLAPEPVYVQPEPVYVQPEPVYVQPEPVYYAPQPEPSYSSSRDDSPSYDSSSDSSSSDD